MKAYVELIQRKEREINCDVLTHQKVCRLRTLLVMALPG
jgi:isocitrate lyase